MEWVPLSAELNNFAVFKTDGESKESLFVVAVLHDGDLVRELVLPMVTGRCFSSVKVLPTPEIRIKKEC